MQLEKLHITFGKTPAARPVWNPSTGLWLSSNCTATKTLVLQAKNALLHLAKKLLLQARKKAAVLLLKRLLNSLFLKQKLFGKYPMSSSGIFMSSALNSSFISFFILRFYFFIELVIFFIVTLFFGFIIFIKIVIFYCYFLTAKK